MTYIDLLILFLMDVVSVSIIASIMSIYTRRKYRNFITKHERLIKEICQRQHKKEEEEKDVYSMTGPQKPKPPKAIQPVKNTGWPSVELTPAQLESKPPVPVQEQKPAPRPTKKKHWWCF